MNPIPDALTPATALSFTRLAKHIWAERLADAKKLVVEYVREYPDTPDKSEQGLANVAEEIADHAVSYAAAAAYHQSFDGSQMAAVTTPSAVQ